MAYTIQQQEDDLRQLKVKIEVPEEQIQQQMRLEARQLAQEGRFPGFRKGKIPYSVLLRLVGEQSLRAQAVDELLEPLVSEVLEELAIETPYPASLDDLQLNPVVFELTIPLQPVVELGDYRAMRRDLPTPEVSEEALAAALERLQERFASLTAVERPSQPGDVISLTGWGRVASDDEPFWQSDADKFLLDGERTLPGTPFVDNLIGLSAGDERDFGFTFADEFDAEELAGEEASFHVSVEAVESRDLPPLDDALAQKTDNYASLDELRAGLRRQLQRRADEAIMGDALEEALDQMVTEGRLHYPPAAVEARLDDLMAQFEEELEPAEPLAAYLKKTGQSEAELRAAWRENAESDLKRGLALAEFAGQEKLAASRAEVEQSLDERFGRLTDDDENRAMLRRIFNAGRGRQAIRNDILRQKVYDRLRAILSGAAPDLAALPDQEADADHNHSHDHDEEE
ncbi:MAG: trigger factor [Candidatus Promineifilaceae bacterium]